MSSGHSRGTCDDGHTHISQTYTAMMLSDSMAMHCDHASLANAAGLARVQLNTSCTREKIECRLASSLAYVCATAQSCVLVRT